MTMRQRVRLQEDKNRQLEACLLHTAGLVLVAGGLLFYLTERPSGDKTLLLAVLLTVLGFYVTHLWLRFSGHLGNQHLFPLAAFLTGMGLICLYRLAPPLATRQFWWLFLSLGTFVLMTTVLRRYRVMKSFSNLALIGGITLLAVTAVWGIEAGGARSWLSVGAWRFEPAELVKILVLLFLAGYLDKSGQGSSPRSGNRLAQPEAYVIMAAAAIIFLLLLWQRDLGTAALILGTVTILLLVGRGLGRLTSAVVGLIILGGIIAYSAFPYIQTRVEIWQNPWLRADAAGYQLVQANYAMASGGIWGSGLGLGRPDLVPAAATDFIFIVVTEELGLVGGAGIIILYLLLTWQGLDIARRAREVFGFTLAAGVGVMFGLQSWLILGGVTGLIPLTGLPLPFMSYGGSSLVVSYILLGLLLNVDHHAGHENEGIEGYG